MHLNDYITFFLIMFWFFQFRLVKYAEKKNKKKQVLVLILNYFF